MSMGILIMGDENPQSWAANNHHPVSSRHFEIDAYYQTTVVVWIMQI